MNDMYVTVCGNTTSDPTPRTTSRGEPMVTLRIASTPWRYDSEQRRYVDLPTNYLDVVAYRHLARHVAASVGKGDPIVVHGKLRVKQWEKDGRTGTNVEIEAATLGHDLARGVSSFARSNQGAPTRPDAPVVFDPGTADSDDYVVRSA